MNKGGKDLQISIDGEGDRIVADGELTVLIKGNIFNLFQLGNIFILFIFLQKKPTRNEMLILGMVDQNYVGFL